MKIKLVLSKEEVANAISYWLENDRDYYFKDEYKINLVNDDLTIDNGINFKIEITGDLLP